MAAITTCSDFGDPQNKVWHCFHHFSIISHEVMGPDAMILVFWMLSFKPTFSLSSFPFINRLFSSSSLPVVLLLLLSRFSHVWLVRSHGQQPTRLPHPWDSPGKNTGVGCHFLLQCMKMKSESEVSQSCPILATPWTAAYQAPLSLGFSRQNYWSGVPLPSPSSSVSST